MGFGAAVRICLDRYLTFSGRAGRPEFWWFALFVVLGSLLAGKIDLGLFGPGPRAPVTGVFQLSVAAPLLAAAWRRMHDTGRSGLFVLYPLIVFVGVSGFIGLLGGGEVFATGLQGVVLALGGAIAAVALFVLMISPLLVLWWLSRPGQSGPNRWGPDPRAV